MLKMTQAILDGLIAHAQKEAPIEVCGYLAKTGDVVSQQYPTKNVDESKEHFRMAPAEQFKVIRKVRAGKQILCGVYHSHPETPARPSDEDIRLAYDPNLSYVIVSLSGGEPVVKSYLIEKGKVKPEDIEIIR